MSSAAAAKMLGMENIAYRFLKIKSIASLFPPHDLSPCKFGRLVSMLSVKGRLHSISFSFSVGNDLCVVPVSICKGNGTQAVPYNDFTNYDAIICKRGRFIL